MNQQVGQAMLARLGVSSDVADDGAQAVAMCRSKAYDVVLMDVLMPIMDGLEATRRLRALPVPAGRGSLRILGMTAQVQSEALDRCRAAGMDECLTKPISLKQLGAALGLALTPAMPSTGVFMDKDQELDLARALDYALDPSGLPALIETFMDSLAASRKALNQAFQDRDANQVALQLHAFKGFMPIFAGASLSSAIVALEQQSRTQALASLCADWQAMAPRLDRLVEELTRARQRYHS
jgi:CheY-like chemotaxis protein